MKLIWITDSHFEFVSPEAVNSFLGTVARLQPDAVLFTGDISVASRIDHHLAAIATSINCQIYFVLGNHDFYGGSFDSVKATVAKTCGAFPNLNHLGHGEIVSLDSETVLIGHGGWADGRAGNGLRSNVQMNDFIHINDLRLERHPLYEALEKSSTTIVIFPLAPPDPTDTDLTIFELGSTVATNCLKEAASF